jgi:hypothetical protein
MNGFPWLTADQRQQVETSSAIHGRVNWLLQLVNDAGGDVTWEQPPASVALLGPCSESLRRCAVLADTTVAHCRGCPDPSQALNKVWMFGFSHPAFAALGATCSCSFPHISFRGKRDNQGSFLSAQTATYPQRLYHSYACVAFKLMFGSARQMPEIVADDVLPPLRPEDFQPWAKVTPLGEAQAPPPQLVPAPQVGRQPQPSWAIQDGGGITSNADWLQPRTPVDVLLPLRRTLDKLTRDWSLLPRFRAAVNTQSENHLLTPGESQTLRSAAVDFLAGNDISSSTTVVPHQPFTLDLWQGFSTFLRDVDTQLPETLKLGVPTGNESPIEASGVWYPVEVAQLFEDPLLVHTSAWAIQTSRCFGRW